MPNITRHRNPWVVVGVCSTLVLLFWGSSIRTWVSGSRNDLENIVLEDPSLDALFRSTDELNQLYVDEPRAHEHSIKWSDADGIPETRVFAHFPGFTVLQNVYTLNGTLFLVTEHRKRLPSLKYMLSAYADVQGGQTLVDLPTHGHIRAIDHQTARQLFGLSARELRGSTWLSNDPLAYTDESFVLEFLRTHYMQEHRAHFNTSILPPTRILFPRISNTVQHTIPGLSSIPRLLFPSSGVGFKEDWEDYVSAHRPFVLETVVLIDRSAAARNPKLTSNPDQARAYFEIGSPMALFRLVNDGWWTFWRKRMADMVGIETTSWHGETTTSVRPVITYISRQERTTSRLDAEDHQQLVDQLKKLRTSHGYEVNIADPTNISFLERVRLALRTTVMVGPTGSDLVDAMWMNPTSLSLLLEFFPDNYISSKRIYVAKTVGVPYLAWRGDRVWGPKNR
ncbi:hypothetical protein M408DRAFT_21397 [Serendipita vermifera MAFF 305830]|uniref:Glycosyltransferase 61 catalytic domain-containing protein n=1 Tax=Serendipita vermifera MAFF 305830 TaxID=933852 RepID=A0A0C3BGQ1_SERVB|nr:hypothetical protein M408DRAFT_21397 [Serendipita vermifera MAFF 305830]